MLRHLFAVLLGCLLVPPAHAWGVLGHRTVARIAENHLTPKARHEIAALLGGESLPLVSTFPDEIRSYPDFKYTAPWHYLDTTPRLPYAQYAAVLDTLKHPNAYLAIRQMQQQLQDPSRPAADRVFALKFLVHLVGDVHQPMHAGHADDQGGNKVAVRFQGKELNLHSLWDSALLEYEGMTYTELAQAYDHASPRQLREWQQAPVATWLFESYQLSEPLYAEAAQHPAFDYRYYPAHAAMLEQRILQAGIRLAGLLNRVFA